MSFCDRALYALARVLPGILLTATLYGQGGFAIDRARVQVGLPEATEVKLVDLDRNGLLDVVRVSRQDFQTLLQDAAGRLVPGTVLRLPSVPMPTLMVDAAFGDLDAAQDGAPDVVLLYSDGTVDLLLNDGTGTLAVQNPRPIQPSFPSTGRQVLVGDLSGDGFDDVVLLQDGVPPLLMQANRMGGFVDVTAGNVPLGIALTQPHGVLADIDGDRDLDLIVVAEGNTVPPLLLENTGGGVLSRNATSIPQTALRGRTIIAADLAGGPLPELVVGLVGSTGRPPAVYANTGGIFTLVGPQAFNAAGVRELMVADVNGNRVLDLLALQEDGALFAALNDGTARFGAAVPILSSGARAAAAAGDLEGDGDADLYTAGYAIEDQILLGDGQGRWFDTEEVGFPIGPARAGTIGTLVDVDGNRDLDLVAFTPAGVSRVFRNDGSAAFTGPALPLLPNLPTTTIWREIHAASVLRPQGNGLLVLGGLNAVTPEPVRVLVNRGGGYADETASLWPPGLGLGYLTMAVARIGAGSVSTAVLDDVVLVTTGGELALIRNIGGAYAQVPAFPTGLRLGSASQILTGDLNRDGSLDVVVLNAAARPRVFLGLPGPQFVERMNAVSGNTPGRRGTLADLDGNGVLDLLFVPPTGVGVSALLGDGTGRFANAAGSLIPALGSSYQDVAVLDVEGVRRVVLARESGADHMLTKIGTGYARPVALPFRGSFRSIGLHVADLDLDGDEDLIVERHQSMPGLLLGDSLHLSKSGVAQIGRSLGFRMVAPAPGELLFLLLGPPTPGPVPLPPFGYARIVNPTNVWSSLLMPGQRSIEVDLPLPGGLVPGRLPLQGASLSFALRSIRLTNLEYLDLTSH